MGAYIPSSNAQQREMLDFVGVNGFDDLYDAIPPEVPRASLSIPCGLSELEVRDKVRDIAAKNTCFRSIFRGAGAYNHYIPSIVKTIASKEEFVTAYTPYQPEISQGVLQSIFEFQTSICSITGMDVSNASVYDGASAAAEAVAMCRERKRNAVVISACAPPQVISAVKAYCFGNGMTLETVPADQNGVTDKDKLRELLNDGVACVYVQQPNYYGLLEDVGEIAELTHEAGAKLVEGCNPIALGIIKTPAECGADVAVGEGQPLGMPLSFGGPYLGFMAATKAMMRRLPGRIVGQTKDAANRIVYVLTLQAREQHIRREKASSNICSNEALCALTASVYLASMGARGLEQVASLCVSKAHYLAERLCALKGFSMRFGGEFFHEFVTDYAGDAQKLAAALESKGILAGLPVEGGLLWCATEMNSKASIDALIKAIEEVNA